VWWGGSSTYHWVGWVEDVEQALAQRGGEDVLEVPLGLGPHTPQGQEHGQRGPQAEEVLNLGGNNRQ
jgi:hypothetical protein